MRTWTIGLVLVVGCSDRVALSETGTGEASGTDTGVAATSGAPTSEVLTSEALTGDGSSGAQLSGTSTDAMSTGSGESSASTGAPLEGCASACDRTSMFVGNINIGPGDDTGWLKCVTLVVGDVFISGDVDAAGLAGLADLDTIAGGLTISDNQVLADLAPLACLRGVSTSLQLNAMPALTDLSALAGLVDLRQIVVRATGVASLPGLPALTGVEAIALFDNPELVDLGELAGWTIASDYFSLTIAGNAALASLVGAEGLLAQADGSVDVAVQILDSPALTSLAGLEMLTHGHLTLSGLPLVTELEPLAQYQHAGSLTLSGLPLLASLHGLHNLADVAGLFVLGDCLKVGPEVDGMDGLVDLGGLDALTKVSDFGIANNDGLVALAGAPLLHQVNSLTVVENDKLTQAALDAFVAQLDQVPGDLCFGAWEMCSCFEILPW